MKDISLEELRGELRKFFKKEENQSYIYFSAFFLIFSFFLIFIIRPTLKSAFKSKTKKVELERATNFLNSIINKAVVLQSQVEEYRDDFKLLKQAIPERVKIAEVMDEVTGLLKKNNLEIVNISVSDIKLVGKEKLGLKSVILDYRINGKFSDFVDFVDSMQKQRRLKTIPRVSLSVKNEGFLEASEEAVLDIKLKVEAYFL